MYYNSPLLNFTDTKNTALSGLRLGEVLNCIHSDKMEAGCGTSENCTYCGAVNATLQSQDLNEVVVEECRISAINDEESISLDLRITANPFDFKGKPYTFADSVI